MDLFSNLSDDQVALLGCATALVVSGAVMSLSYYIGRNRIASSGAIADRAPTPALELAAIEIGEREKQSPHRSAA